MKFNTESISDIVLEKTNINPVYYTFSLTGYHKHAKAVNVQEYMAVSDDNVLRNKYKLLLGNNRISEILKELFTKRF